MSHRSQLRLAVSVSCFVSAAAALSVSGLSGLVSFDEVAVSLVDEGVGNFLLEADGIDLLGAIGVRNNVDGAWALFLDLGVLDRLDELSGVFSESSPVSELLVVARFSEGPDEELELDGVAGIM